MSDFKNDNIFLQNLLKAATEPAEKKRSHISMAFADPYLVGTHGKTATRSDIKNHAKAVSEVNPLVKSVLNVLNGGSEDSIERLAFDTQPHNANTTAGLWRRKLRLLPDDILKRIGIQDDLVAAILNTRSNHVAAFGRPQPDRFSTGFKIEPEPGYTENMTAEEKKEIQKKIAAAESRLLTCGQTRGWSDDEALNFSQFLFMQARNAVLLGRMATEIIYEDTSSGRKFHSFRPIDAGTIYKASPFKEAAQNIRESARLMLQDIKNKKLEPERYINDEYAWVQVIEGRAVQAFHSDECVVHNFYPVTDVELDGYPLTPLDTVITAVVTHINIGTHNKLFFQSGRAARGMIVIKSDEVDEKVVDVIRQQFQASINAVGNAWRMPIFGVGTDDDVAWFPIDNSSRDMEFQYLSDTNARVILSAFQMSPEEIPGYSHLSRGTNSQALSEGNSEYKLEAHRDVGIRPLLANFQNFVNSRILPLIDPELSKFCSLKFVGLDAETAEKESVRLQQDMAVHMTMDEVLEKVQKNPVGKRWGGRFLLNPQYQAVLDKYFMQGDILEYFFGIEGASKDPRNQFVNNPNWFQWQQLQMEMQQMQQQAEAQQQQAQQQAQQPQGGEAQQPTDLSRSIDQLSTVLGKSEAQLDPSRRKLLHQQRKTIHNVISSLEKEAEDATKEILSVVSKHLPKKKG